MTLSWCVYVTSHTGWLSCIIFSSSAKTIILLTRFGKKIDSVFPAMTAACLYGRQDVVACLIERGASMKVQNARGLSPLLCAASAGHWQLVDVALEQGAPLEQTDKRGRTALIMAASDGHLKTVELLLSKGFVHFIQDQQSLLNWIEFNTFKRRRLQIDQRRHTTNK